MELFKRKSLELAYDAHIVALYKDTLETPDGRIIEYDLIKHKTGGGAGILLVDKEEHIYLVKQYRNSINDISYEIPAGAYSSADEPGATCALREAEEESGFIPQKLYHITNVVSSIGTFDEQSDVFVGTDLIEGKMNLDPNEFIEIVKIPITEALDMVYAGKIPDSKTIIAILGYMDLKNRGIIEL